MQISTHTRFVEAEIAPLKRKPFGRFYWPARKDKIG